MTVFHLVVQGPGIATPDLLALRAVARGSATEPISGEAFRIREADPGTRDAVAQHCDRAALDWGFVADGRRLADFGLLALDMDSTLIDIECVDEIAAADGRKAEVAAITEAAMRGEIADYKESLRRRVAMLAGADAALLGRVYDEKLRLNPGAEELLRACRAAGLKTLLVTGGFTFFTDRMKQRLGFDFTRSNVLEIADGRLSGRVTGPDGGEIVDAEGKAQAVRDACAQIGCPTERSIVIGDGANDLKMLKLAGISVAYRAKPVVAQQAAQALNYSALSGVLAWFGDVR